ncbi:acyl-CoA thioesterase [candidate division KSB1 bacterium]|nr:MAG: acyl-CoA thioesterase [candidate division KSB1 bacterium]
MEISSTRIHVSSKMCKTLDVGLRRTLFGGNMMAWMDEAASILAHKHTGEEAMVTLKFGEIRFVHPVKEGHIVDFFVDNVKVGRTSISFDLEGWTDQKNLVVKTSVVFVAVDKNGRPKAIEKFRR